MDLEQSHILVRVRDQRGLFRNADNKAQRGDLERAGPY